eukprot:s449_g30.t1
MFDPRTPEMIAESLLHLFASDSPEFVADFEENLQRWGRELQKDVVEIFEMPLPTGSIKQGTKVLVPKAAIDQSPMLTLIQEELKNEGTQVLDCMVEKASKDQVQDGWMDAAVAEANEVMMKSYDEAPTVFPIAFEIYRGTPMIPEIIVNRYGGPFSFKDGIVRYHTTGLRLEPAFTVTFHR